MDIEKLRNLLQALKTDTYSQYGETTAQDKSKQCISEVVEMLDLDNSSADCRQRLFDIVIYIAAHNRFNTYDHYAVVSMLDCAMRSPIFNNKQRKKLNALREGLPSSSSDKCNKEHSGSPSATAPSTVGQQGTTASHIHNVKTPHGVTVMPIAPPLGVCDFAQGGVPQQSPAMIPTPMYCQLPHWNSFPMDQFPVYPRRVCQMGNEMEDPMKPSAACHSDSQPHMDRWNSFFPYGSFPHYIHPDDQGMGYMTYGVSPGATYP